MEKEIIRAFENKINVIEPYNINNTNIAYGCFTTKSEGKSKGPYKSLNFGINTNDNKIDIKSNFGLLKNIDSFSNSTIVCGNQIHSNRVYTIEEGLRNSNINEIGDYDGLITNNKEITLFTYHADCLAIFFLDPVNKIIGLAHGGWKGILNNISKEIIREMSSKYKSKPEDIIVYISPGISKCCFETGEEVYEQFISKYEYAKKYIGNRKNNKYHIDLKAMAVEQLKQCGILNIEVSNKCTYCENDLFYSHRRDKGITGRMGAFLKLR